MMKILKLSNGKAVHIDGDEITQDEAHEIIIKLTETWGNDFEKQELKDMAGQLCLYGKLKSEPRLIRLKRSQLCKED